MLSRGVEQLLGRASGPLHFRLVIMPTRGHRPRDPSRPEGRPGRAAGVPVGNPQPTQRSGDGFSVSGLKDISQVFIVAFVLDTAYQLFVLRAFYVVQTSDRGRGMRHCAVCPVSRSDHPPRAPPSRKQAGPTSISAANTTEGTGSPPGKPRPCRCVTRRPYDIAQLSHIRRKSMKAITVEPKKPETARWKIFRSRMRVRLGPRRSHGGRRLRDGR